MDTAVVGVLTYVGGVLTRPLSNAVERAFRRREERERLRTAIYAELAANMNKLLYWYNPGCPEGPPIQDCVRFEVYDRVVRDQPLLLGEIKEAQVIADVKLAFTHLIEHAPDRRWTAIIHIAEYIDALLRSGTLSKRLLTKGAIQENAWLSTSIPPCPTPIYQRLINRFKSRRTSRPR